MDAKLILANAILSQPAATWAERKAHLDAALALDSAPLSDTVYSFLDAAESAERAGKTQDAARMRLATARRVSP